MTSIYTLAIREWLAAQASCPGCGANLSGDRCFRTPSSIWCGVKRLHHVPRDVVSLPEAAS